MAKNGLRGPQSDSPDPMIEDHINDITNQNKPATPAPAKQPTETLGARRKRLGMSPGKNYSPPDDGAASLNPFKNWSNVNGLFKK